MKKFLITFTIFIIPFILMLGYYVIVDPFMVVWKYNLDKRTFVTDNYVPNDALRGIHWMNMHSDSLYYNSFIMGSSRSDFYYVDEWKKYIGNDAVCFHFNQSGDNLQGTLERIRYLYSHYKRIDNILFIMDREYLEEMTQHKGHLFRNPWQVTDELDFFSFHWDFFRAFYTIEYQMSMFSSTESENTLSQHYDSRWNENYKDGAEDLLNSGQYDLYYSRFNDYYALYPRDSIEKTAKPVIKKEQKEALLEIYSLLKSHNTDYRIVISPLYNQEKFNPTDLTILYQIFGENKVFDFSGINDYTQDSTNYYEVSHYRPQLCNKILKYIYDR